MQFTSFKDLRARPTADIISLVDHHMEEMFNSSQGSFERQRAAVIVQPFLNELARCDQEAQTETMLQLNDKMAVYTKWVTWFTVAITGMTMIILSLTFYMAFWKP